MSRPGTFSEEAAYRALHGDTEAVAEFVQWADTPRGIDYWSDVYEDLCAGGCLSAKAYDTIENWLYEEVDETQTSPLLDVQTAQDRGFLSLEDEGCSPTAGNGGGDPGWPTIVVAVAIMGVACLIFQALSTTIIPW